METADNIDYHFSNNSKLNHTDALYELIEYRLSVKSFIKIFHVEDFEQLSKRAYFF